LKRFFSKGFYLPEKVFKKASRETRVFLIGPNSWMEVKKEYNKNKGALKEV